MKRVASLILMFSFTLFASSRQVAAADDAPPKAKLAEGEVVLAGLDNPCGVAVQPETGDIFVSDSAALKIVRLDAKSHKASDVITGFPQDIYGKGPKYNIGPLGLAFIDKDTLVVGGGGLVDGAEVVQIYSVPEAGASITAADTKYVLGPLGPSDDTLMGEGNFYALAVSETAIFVTCNGDDTKGWVSKIDLTNGTPGKLTPFIKTKVETNVDAPVGIALGPGGRLMVGQMGEMNVPTDSLLTMYDQASGKKFVSFDTGLYDIAALAFSPETNKLYAVDFAWMETTKGGIFHLQFKQKGGFPGIEAVQVASLDKPSSLAFAPDGKLYVTVFGTAEEGATEKPGKLLMFSGL